MQPQPPTQQGRPVDVGTAFGLWVTALPVLVVGQGADAALAPDRPRGVVVYAAAAVFLLLVASVVLTFLVLMWLRYRWARTLLTGGGVATIIFVASGLSNTERSTTGAVVYAVTSIVGSVLIAGGIFLLHRKDAHAYFTR